jgi:serine/threonine-protein kinase
MVRKPGFSRKDGGPAWWEKAWRFLGNRRVLLLAGGLALVGFGGGYLVATRLIFPVPPPPGGLVPVPDLSGATPETVTDTLAALGLTLQPTDSLNHPTSAPGVVLGQDPLPGQLAIRGDTVRVAISNGPERRPVPDVLRLRADRARTVLEAAGFEVKVDSVDSDLPLGGVLSMTPQPGTEATVPMEISLRVSRGPPMLEMPLLLGLEESQAVALLDSLGLEVGEIETRFRFGRDQGLVVDQDPPARTMVQQGSEVRLVVGRRGGQAPVTPSRLWR